MTKFKTFKRAAAAWKYAGETKPVIRIGDVYLVAEGEHDPMGLALTEIELIAPPRLNGTGHPGREYAGHITMRHLTRLGNGNWATAGKDCGGVPDWLKGK